MKPLTGSDSSILAYLASAPNISAAEHRKLIAQLSADAKEIAGAVQAEHKRRKQSRGRNKLHTSALSKTARALVSWA
jgi:hypothetical protein